MQPLRICNAKEEHLGSIQIRTESDNETSGMIPLLVPCINKDELSKHSARTPPQGEAGQ